MPVRKYARGPATIGGVVVDAVTTETHTATSEVTEHRVESGGNVTDHIHNKPLELSMDCVVSDTPFSTEQIQRTRDANGVSFLSTADSEVPAGALGNAYKAYTDLLALREARQTILVTTVLRDYTDMAITSISTPVTAATGDALSFTITFKQIEFVTLETTTVNTIVPRVKGKNGKTKTGDLAAGAIARNMNPAAEAVNLSHQTKLKQMGGYGGALSKLTGS